MRDDIYFHEKYKMWWPKFDHKPDGNHHMVMSGINAIDLVLKYCKGFDLCIQAGGHLGYWPNKLSEHFQAVWSFEADPIVHACLCKNINSCRIVTSCNALADVEGVATMRRGSSAGGTRIAEGGKIKVGQVTIDSIEFHQCDAILLDIEGGEISALKGAKKTIERFSPVILVEELLPHKEELWSYLASINYKRVDGCGKDGIWIKL